MNYKSMFCAYCLCNIENNENRVENFCSIEHKKLFEREDQQESGSLQNYFNKSKSTMSKNKKGGIAHHYLENI